MVIGVKRVIVLCLMLIIFIRVFFLVCTFYDSGFNLLILALLVAI